MTRNLRKLLYFLTQYKIVTNGQSPSLDIIKKYLRKKQSKDVYDMLHELNILGYITIKHKTQINIIKFYDKESNL